MKKAVLFLADGFEETEALGTADFLRRGGIETVITSINEEMVAGSHGVKVLADALWKDEDVYSADALILPGGGAGAEALFADGRVVKAVKDFFVAGKLVAAICAAPVVFDKAGILEGKNFTVYPSVKGRIKSGRYCDKRSVEDGNVITGSGPGAVFVFAEAVTSYLVGEEVSARVARDMLLPAER